MLLKLFILGIITALPYVFGNLYILSYVSLSAVIILLIKSDARIKKKRSAYAQGFVFGMGYFGMVYNWFMAVYPMEFAGIGKVQAALLLLFCWLGLSALQAFEFGFVTLLYLLSGPSMKKPLRSGLMFMILWVVFEWQQTLFWRGVPWARLALTQSGSTALLQNASLFGSLFTSGLIVFINVLIAVAAIHALNRISEPKINVSIPCTEKELGTSGINRSGSGADRILSGKEVKLNNTPDAGVGLKTAVCKVLKAIKNKKTAVFALSALFVFTANLVFGTIRMEVKEKDGADTAIQAAVIQGNISSNEKWSQGSTELTTERYIELTEKCVSETGVEIVVWPETAIPVKLRYYPSLVNRLSALSEKLGIYLFVGALDTEIDESGDVCEYNAIYMFDQEGNLSENVYYKRRPVPFGEYVPMRKLVFTLFPFLDSLNMLSDDLTPGTESKVFGLDGTAAASLICFDSIYETLALDAVRDGAEFLMISTNDSWFADSAALTQHCNHARLRAIETGRYVLRAANTGISAVIDDCGNTIAVKPALETGYATAGIYPESDRTLYSYVGNIFAYICFMAVTSVFTYRVVKRSVKRKNIKTVTIPQKSEPENVKATPHNSDCANLPSDFSSNKPN